MPAVGCIGLGKMGYNLVLRLQDLGVSVVAYNRSPESLARITKEGVRIAQMLPELVQQLQSPRVFWLMVTAGKPVDEVLEALLPYVMAGDVVIDGGNSHYKDSQRRHALLKDRGIGFLDMGMSGGVEGARSGPCLMVGGDTSVVTSIEAFLRRVAQPDGYLHVGPPGAGHYVKMVHNGIEYAILQAYADGFHLLQQAPFDLNLPAIARNWQHGSVVRSWMLELLERAFAQDADLSKVPGAIAGGETGRWAVEEAKERGVLVDSIELALRKREESRQKPSFAGKIVMAIRRGYHGSDT